MRIAGLQKKIIRETRNAVRRHYRHANDESRVESPTRPRRVLECMRDRGTDAVMLSRDGHGRQPTRQSPQCAVLSGAGDIQTKWIGAARACRTHRQAIALAAMVLVIARVRATLHSGSGAPARWFRARSSGVYALSRTMLRAPHADVA